MVLRILGSKSHSDDLKKQFASEREKKISVLKKAIISKLFPGGSLISTSFDGKSLALKLFQLFLATGEWALELPYLGYLACCRFQLKGSNLILFL